ncbi:MAG: 16S rRNA (uracil(1498)-N(3))-methyltransferase [Candidatus Rokubacteria bacterium]|nr:16S rRNA (uracil(1498)-N(3))-methyltransferase [Candidatus Rokubacteria bacterium]
MRRFAIAPERIEGARVHFDREETRHLARVLRLRPGDAVIAVDGTGRDYTVRIETLGDTATGTILEVATRPYESSLAVTLIQGIPKGDKMEPILRAASELGVVRVLPAIAERTIVRLEPGRWRDRARRWQRVAREAAKQCGRAVIPEIALPRPLGEWLERAEGADLMLCLWEGESPPIGPTLDRAAARPSTAAVLVGPEGGLSAEEVAAARARRWEVVRLGPRILRTETAGPAVIAILQYRFGDLHGA